jgi:hypothetical protein
MNDRGAKAARPDEYTSLAAHGSGQAAVLRVTVSRNNLALRETLAFDRGEPVATDYWSFIRYCRTVGQDHRQQKLCYDMVIGPVTGTWKRQTVIPNADQISFHTPVAAAVLNNSVRVAVTCRATCRFATERIRGIRSLGIGRELGSGGERGPLPPRVDLSVRYIGLLAVTASPAAAWRPRSSPCRRLKRGPAGGHRG